MAAKVYVSSRGRMVDARLNGSADFSADVGDCRSASGEGGDSKPCEKFEE